MNEYSLDGNLYCLDIKLLFERKKIHIGKKNSSQICYLPNFYIIKDLEFYNFDGYEELFLESKAFKKLEDNYRLIINNLFRNKAISRIEGNMISDFILNLKIRNPIFLKISESNKVRNIQTVMDELYQDIAKKDESKHIDNDLIKFLINNSGKNLSTSDKYIKSIQIKQLIDKTDSESQSIIKFRESILNCKWFVLDSFNCGFTFFTSDNPGVAVSSIGKIENTKFKGGFEYYFPINYRYCLYFSDKILDNYYNAGIEENKSIEFLAINEIELNFINSLLMVYIDKYLISGKEIDIRNFAENIKKYLN